MKIGLVMVPFLQRVHSGTAVWLLCSSLTAVAQPTMSIAALSVWPTFARGEPQSVRVAGHYAYVALRRSDGSGGLAVLDVIQPAKPRLVGHLDTPGSGLGMDVAGQFAYLAGADGLDVIEISDPGNPILAGSTPGGAWGVRLAGHFAYAAGTDGLLAVDVSDPTHPVRVGSYAPERPIKNFQITNSMAYAAEGDRLELIRLNAGTNFTPAPTLPASTEYGISDVQVAGRYLFLANAGLTAVDVLDPLHPLVVSHRPAGDFNSAAIAVAEHYAYVVTSESSIVLFDI